MRTVAQKEYHRKYMRDWFAADPARRARRSINMLRYREKHKQRLREKAKAHRLANLADLQRKKREYYLANHEVVRAKAREYHKRTAGQRRETLRQQSKRATDKLRAVVFAEYGNKCVCCQESAQEFMTIDHINGRGSHDRKTFGARMYRWLKKNGFPKDNFRLLCMNCNFSYGMRGYCPHQKSLVVS